MLQADSAVEISGKFLHSYIRTRHTSALRAPGRIRYAYRLGAETRRVRSRTSILLPSPGVGMYECTNPVPSSFAKPSIRARETRIFVHSYVLTLTADRRRLVRSACTAAFYLFIRFGCRYRVYHYMNSVQFSLTH